MKYIDRILLKYMLIGAGCTLCSAILMLLFYNLAHMGYWLSSAVSYLVGCALSYTLNRRLTFYSTERVWRTLPKYALNVALCYTLSYSLAKPAMSMILSRLHVKTHVIEQVAMLVGIGLFGVLNYFGQRLFTFREKKD